ncbi:long-chain fatty acid--CoA ligase [Muribaculaceae bacterium Isolate-013 (NCI)]|nr:long-chain fatty acid--CoA ligase [Muribaculaceae bacterium Isolate-013 (NCI)]
MKNLLIQAIADSIKGNSTLPALSDFGGQTLTFRQLGRKIAEIHILYKAIGLRQGDKVALCAKNSASWAVTFLATMTYGAVPVPLLHEFHPDQIVHLTVHSEARLLFTEKSIADNIDTERLAGVEAVMLLDSYTPVFSRVPELEPLVRKLPEAFARIYPEGFTPEDIRYADPAMNSLALINYTSGSSGNPKGVMLSYRNIWSNVSFGLANIDFLHPGDNMLSMLPLAHMYGLVFELLFPLCRGCHITFLGRVPSPKVLLQAFAATRPKLVITVPLVIEKIVKSRILPRLSTPAMRLLLAIPGIRGMIYSKVRDQLIQALGGNLRQLILGGAALSDEVEALLRKIRFPFTIGYGMTECAPLITYEWWETQRPHSCGRLCHGMEARILSDDYHNTPGVLFVKGDNVMMGYYKNPESTEEALCPDGWLRTGDVCTMDNDGYLYIRGRDKNMILSSSGQNIYPEEIEAKLNNLPLVAESVVVERDGRIVALVHPAYDLGRQEGLTDTQTEQRVTALLPQLNKLLPAYSRVSTLELHRDEFEKTPKHSIRRFIYK